MARKAFYFEGEFIRERDFADLVGVCLQTARNWRRKGVGPRYYRWTDQTVRYRASDIQDWVEEHGSESPRS
jgi:hypothetical protein